MKRYAIALTLLTLGACSTSPADDRAADGTCAWSVEPLLTASDAAAAQLAPASPFPSDVYTVSADTPTGLRNDVRGQGILFQDSVNEMDGWAPHGPIRIDFSGTVTTASLPMTVTASTAAEASIQLVRLGGTPERVPFRLKLGDDAKRVYLFPFRPLLEQTRYAIVVRNTIRPDMADCFGRNRTFANILAGGEPEDFPGHVPARIRETMARLEEAAAALELDPGTIALAVPYTTQSVTRTLVERYGMVTQAPIDPYALFATYAVENNGSLNPALDARFPDLPQDLEFGIDVTIGNVGHMVIGRFNSANFMENDLLSPSVRGRESLEFLMTIPRLDRVRPEYRAALGDPVRFPVVIFGHGLTACKETLLGVAHIFSEYGIALAGIDVVEHGTRITVSNDSCGSSIAEGLRLIRFGNPASGRAQFHQTVLDEVQLVHMLVSNAGRNYLDGVTTAPGTLQVDTFGYIGQSLGGILGTLLTTIEPRIGTSVLNVPGGGLLDYAALLDEGTYKPFDLDVPGRFLYESMAGLQTIFGPSDPLYFAPYLAREKAAGLEDSAAKNVLVQQSMDDGIIPAYLTENLARAIGAVQVTPAHQPVEQVEIVEPPYRGTEVTLALQQYVMPDKNITGGKDWDPHYALILANDPKVWMAEQEQAAHFLRTGIFEGTAEVIDGYTRVP